MDLVAAAMATAKAVKLRYVKTGTAGYSRERAKEGFYYLDQHGKLIEDEETLKRIKALVLPPAWEQVWISPYANGHLQATGIDAMGRRQYRYHSTWMRMRNEIKYERLYSLGQKLPLIRRRIQKDLRKKDLSKEKVIALAIS